MGASDQAGLNVASGHQRAASLSGGLIQQGAPQVAAECVVHTDDVMRPKYDLNSTSALKKVSGESRVTIVDIPRCLDYKMLLSYFAQHHAVYTEVQLLFAFLHPAGGALSH